MDKKLETLFEQQLETSKRNVREFINVVFGEGKGTEYSDRAVYDEFHRFNFDLLNYECMYFEKSREKLITTWCDVPIKIYLDDIEKDFVLLTGIQDVQKLETISKLNNRKFRGTSDPDSMKIVCDILFILYSKVVKNTLDNLEQAEAEKLIEKQDITGLFKGDTMHSFHFSFGHPEYQGQSVKNTPYEYIFMYPYITGFSKVKSVSPKIMEKIKNFFNQYHTLGNFVLTPAIKVGKNSVNTYRSRYNHDDYYTYVNRLFEGQNLLSYVGNDGLVALIRANQGFFSSYQGQKEKYCKDLDIPYEKSHLYIEKRQAAIELQDDKSIETYLDVLEDIIKARCNTMIEKLYQALQR